MLEKKLKGIGLKKFREAVDCVAAAQSMGARIRALREVQRLTQAELGSIVGVSAQAVCQWESGATAAIRTETFIRLVQALETDYVFLVWGTTHVPELVKRPKVNP